MLKKFLGQSTIYLTGSAIGMITSFISLPILTRVFTTSEYGLFSLISISVFLLLAIAKFGMQHSAARFYDEFRLKKRNEGIQVYYSTLFWGSLAIATIISVFFIMGMSIFPFSLLKYEPHKLFWIIGGLIVSEAMFVRIQNFLRIEQRAKPFVLIGVIQRYGKIATGFVFLFFVSKSVYGFLTGTLFLNIIMLLIVVLLFMKKESLKFIHFSFSFLRENIIYGYPLIGFELSSLMIKFVDRYFIEWFIGINAVGLYSVAGNLSMEISDNIFSSVLLAVSPAYMKIWSEDGDKKTQEFISTVIKLLALISIPMIFGLAAISHDIIIVFATNKFKEAAATVPFLIAGAVLWGFSPIFGAGLFIHKKTKIFTKIVLVGTALNIGLNLIMIPQWGIMGAAAATFITYTIVIILTIKASFQCLKINVDVVSIVQFIFASLFMYLILYLIPLNISLLSLIFKIGVGIVSYSLILIILSAEIREWSLKVFKILSKPLLSQIGNR